MKKTVFLPAAALLLLAACGSGNEAGEANFKKALEESGGGRHVCLPLVLDVQTPDGQPAFRNVTVGEPLLQYAVRDVSGKRINETAAKQVEILAKEGFYRKVKTQGGEDKNAPAVFELTEKGAAQARGTPRGPLFCVGKQKIGKINWFTTPTPDNGFTVSEVSYQAELDAKKWADKLIKAGGKEWEPLKEPSNRSVTLVQTNKGWKDMRDLSR